MQLKSLLNTLISEVGEGNSQPFEYSATKGIASGMMDYVIKGITSKGDNIDIELSVIVGGTYLIDDIDSYNLAQKDGNVMYISFSIESINGETPDRKYGEINDVQYMFRLMATLKEIMLPLIEKEDVSFITYSPSSKVLNYSNDRGKGRDILYRLFIKKEFPNSEVHENDGRRLIVLNR
jgi:hypothetical protein